MMPLDSLCLRYSENEFLILDQTQLPHQEVWVPIQKVSDMIHAIKTLQVRGAPLIGVAAALALAQSARQGTDRKTLLTQAKALYEARPTAVNLMNCIARMKKVIESTQDKNLIEKTALDLFNEDVLLADRMAQNGVHLIQDGDNILTHCNTGGLATVGIGTALGVIIRAHQNGKKIHVFVDETRPLLQGGRLTTWELRKHQIPHTLITDNMAGHLMSLGKIHKVFLGSDRIATNGDFANKIGTYSVAVLAHFHKVPFYVVAPYTTVDPFCSRGEDIPIEQRDFDEVRGAKGSFGNVSWAPAGTHVYNPSFDVTPFHLVSGWVLDQKFYTPEDIQCGELKKIKVE